MACGELARMLDFKDAEEYAVAGLLHDLGKVVATVQLPDLKPEIERVVAERDLYYLEAEREVLGFGHGGLLGAEDGQSYPYLPPTARVLLLRSRGA